jgi:hypothetical protein
VLVRFFFDETGGFLGVTLDAHCFLLIGWLERISAGRRDCSCRRLITGWEGTSGGGPRFRGLKRLDFGSPKGK